MFRKLMKKPSRFPTREYKGIDKKKKEKGSITLEATIFLTIFIMFYMFFIYLVQITKAQIVLQYTINEVAKEVSAYSYVLTKTGTIDKRVSTAESANEFKGRTTEVIDSFKGLGNILSSGGGNIIEKAEETKGAIEDTYNKTESYANDYLSDPESLLNQIIGLAKSEGANLISDAIIGNIVKGEVEKQIELMSHKSADEYLKDLGIVGGMEGLSFSETKWAEEKKGNMPVLEVAVVYEMDMNLVWFELEPRRFKLCAKTALW